MTQSKETNAPERGGCTLPKGLDQEVPSYSEACTSFTKTLQYTDIPQRSIQQVKIYLLDWLGCLIRGAIREQSSEEVYTGLCWSATSIHGGH